MVLQRVLVDSGGVPANPRLPHRSPLLTVAVFARSTRSWQLVVTVLALTIIPTSCSSAVSRTQVNSAPPPVAESVSPPAQAQRFAPSQDDSPGIHLTFQQYRCKSDAEIPASERKAIEDAALSFLAKAWGSDVKDAYAMMTSEARAVLTAETLSAAMQSSGLPPLRPSFKVDHTYLVESNGSVGRAICGLLRDNQWVSVAMGSGRRQAHVLVSAQTRNNDWQMSIWLWPEESGWKVHHCHVGLSGVAGLGALPILDLARRERREGHAFNAMVLYSALRNGLLDRGPAFQLGLAQAVDADCRVFEPPPEILGEPPYVWKMDGVTYRVGHISIIGVAQQLGVVFELTQKEWNGEAAADNFNHQFLTAFVSTRPDYVRVFGFVLARSMKPDGSGGFGTVYEAGKGFTH